MGEIYRAQCVMNADLRRAFDAQGRCLPFDEWPADLALAVDAVEFERGELRKITLKSRSAARDLLARHTGFYDRHNARVTEKHDVR